MRCGNDYAAFGKVDGSDNAELDGGRSGFCIPMSGQSASASAISLTAVITVRNELEWVRLRWS